MTHPGLGDGADEEFDPEVLEELEFWVDPDEEAREGESEPPLAEGAGGIALVGTPIGNLGDLSPRAVATLRAADVIYCEDTRHSRKLLTHAGISGASLRSLHEHNEVDRIAEVLGAAGEGRTVAVVSDAGMPLISDPGGRLVAAAIEAGVPVTSVPGPSAALAALVSSGLSADRFCFEGFLPRSGRSRSERLEALVAEPRTAIIFEAPGRVAATLADLQRTCGADRLVAVARELTKLHEEIWRGPLAEAVAWVGSRSLRGEVVLVVSGAAPVAEEPVGDAELSAALAEGLGRGERTRGVVDDVAGRFGVPRRRVYELALATREASTEEPSEPV